MENLRYKYYSKIIGYENVILRGITVYTIYGIINCICDEVHISARLYSDCLNNRYSLHFNR